MNDPQTHAAGLIRCPACYYMMQGPWVEGGETLRECDRCRQFLRISVFPALGMAPPMPAQSGARAMEGDATCFFHPEKRAERPCDRCGRFLCALCDLPVGARHLCPSCLKAGPEDNVALPELVTKRLSWGRLSLLLAVVPITILGVYISWATAPAAIFAALYGWNKPGSLVHGKRRLSALVGLLLGLAQVGGFTFLIYTIWHASTHHAG
jgi:hypothetical protein